MCRDMPHFHTVHYSLKCFNAVDVLSVSQCMMEPMIGKAGPGDKCSTRPWTGSLCHHILPLTP